ncbi:uncharacterized protein bif isoform X2 [Ochlerotatus camptorhynchus]|uniref:uncharacterized protein bif isoform X2 n=1 Tax=Ochlerotatus camptorhynchus TaxID=644619 RepID=UPI0031D3CFB3
MMADATNNSSSTSNNTASATSGEPIPQWKKELLQRRKNLAKTIGTAATQVHDSASTVAAALTTTPTTPRVGGPSGGNPFGSGGQKATTPTSLFGAPVFVGHSPPAANEQPQSAVLVKSAFVGGATTTAASSAATRATEVPLHATPQSHSNDGPESTSCSTSRSLSHLHSSNNSGASSGGPVGKYAAATSGSGISASVSVDCELTRPASSGETSSNSYSSEIGCWKSKKNTSSASSSSSPKMVAASAEEIIYEKNPRFVGPGGEGTPVDVDPSEELKYGPGIVSKLRCRYLSLALRQSANKQRPSLNNMRRATSLNNLLDEEGEDLSEREQSIEAKDHHQLSQDKGYFQQQGKFGHVQSNQMNAQPPKAKTPDEYISTFQKSVQNSYTRSGRQTEKKNEYNRYNKQRGADSLKRARSVEALVRYDHKAWERDIQKENLYSSNDSNVIILDEITCTNGTNGNNTNNCQSVAMNKADLITDCVTIEEKIINGREKGDPKPKRLTSFIDADERPPPDVVRQTMKIFEANANRRGRPVARTNGAAGEVAAKVASYKSIISHEKPPITHPKPPLSPKKPNIIPRTTSPKPNGTPAPANAPTAVANGLKDKPNLPKLDINVIRNNLETTNNLKNSAAATTPIQTPPPANHNNNITTSTPLSVRVVESQTYRLKYDSPALSPNNTAATAAAVVVAQHKVTSSTTTNRSESPRACMQNNTNSTALAFVDSPSIPTLASKLNNLNIVTSTPTSTRSPTPQDLPPQAPPRHIPLQYATSDEEDPDDPEDQQHEYSINNSDCDDDDDDDHDYQSDDLEPEGDDEFDFQEVKKVSRSAMDNISKAGVTTQFRFNGQSSQQNKSHLPALTGGAKLLSNKKLNVDDHHQSASNSSSSSSSPITVPAVAAAAPVVIAHKPPVPLSRESLASTNGLKPINNNNNNNNSNIGSVTHNLSNVSNSNANTNNSVSSNNGSKVVINDSVAPAPPNVSVSSDVSSKTVNLTAREIEKNQINLEKSEESLNNSAGSAAVATAAAASAVANSASVVLTKASGGDVATSGGDFFMAKWGGATAQKPAETVVVSSPLAGLVPTKKKVKAPPPPIEANTMVFNFSDRKEVPDYIENDGIILRPRPRELPKPGESGFVVLGDLTLETSTDPDDSWAMGPPSPCDVEFANANIVINGKSSMRNKTTRDSKFKIQFDDSLTSTFEYPSETSLLEANGYGGGGDDTTDTANGLKDAAAILAAVTINSSSGSSSTNGGGQQQTMAATATADSGGGGGLTFGDNGLLSHKNNLLSSMPLGSAPFASYTPVKAAIDTNFELGVTRTPSPSSTASSSTASSTCSSNSSNATAHNNDHHQPHQQQQQQQQQPQQSQHHNHSNGHHHHHHHLHQQQQQQRINGTDGSGLLLLNGEMGEPESIQYLKPASDEQTVNWSQGTRVTDLLF